MVKVLSFLHLIESKGWKFHGWNDGFYLVRIATIKGFDFTTDEFELESLNAPFDIENLYFIPHPFFDNKNSVLDGTSYSVYSMYYQLGTGYDLHRDLCIDISLDDGCFDEQVWDTYLMQVIGGNKWLILKRFLE